MVQAAPTLAERAADLLREQVIGGELPPGSRVKAEDVAERLGMSPIPVREALRALAAGGLLVALPRRGYRVAEISQEDLEDIYRLRVLLDPLAVRLAVPELTAERHAEIEDAFAHLVDAYAADDWDAHRVHHRRFHFGIYDACGSPWLLRIIAMLWESSERYQRLSVLRRDSIEDRAAEHRGIMEACRRGDAQDAARRMRDHLELTLRSVKRLPAAEGEA